MLRRRRTLLAGSSGRALQQDTPSVPVCTWVGAQDGTCKGPTDGCCRVNPAYLLQNFPDSLANKLSIFPSDGSVCSNILAPTKLDTVKAVSGIGGMLTQCWIVHGSPCTASQSLRSLHLAPRRLTWTAATSRAAPAAAS